MVYRSNNTAGKGGMAFILSLTLSEQVRQLEAPLIARINHIALIFNEIKAILDADQDKKLSEEDRANLKIISDNIDALRDSYEPFIDDPEARQTADSKRKKCEKLLDLTRYYLLFLVEKHKLCDISTLKHISGVSWENEE
ncbi:hypothetical protein ACSAZL_12440 [Methanosarcina sp. T3]|uniref:hypothetical protein n=1 Tax=Methanosarcina sp. T3 TaxID=3439062 RepID=UPI003F872BA8